MEELRHKDVWNGEYCNVRYEIVRWRLGGNYEGSHIMWNYYLYLPLDQIPKKAQHFFILRAKKSHLPSGRYHHEHNTPVISELDWHGGLTFYEKKYGVCRELEGIKLGCDYGHHFDERIGYNYTVEYVDKEARHTINTLQELIPDLKVSCSWNGNFYDRSEGSFNEHGVFTSFEGQKASDDFHKEK